MPSGAPPPGEGRSPEPSARLADIPWRSQVLPFVAAHWLLVARFLLTSLSRSATSIAVILLIKEFLSGVLSDQQGLAATLAASVGATAALWIVVGALLATFFAGAGLYYDNQVVTQRIVRLVELTLMERLLAHLLTLPVSFFDRQRHGDILESVRQDITKVRLALMALVDLAVQGAQAAAYLVAVVLLSPRLAALSLPVILLAAGPVWWVARFVRVRSFRVRRHGFVLTDLLLQILRGIRIVKVYAGEAAETRNSVDTARAYFSELIEVTRLYSLSNVALEALGGLTIVIVTIVGGFAVMGGSITWPSLLAFLIAVRALHGPLANINHQYMEVQRQWASVYRLQSLFGTESSLRDRPGAVGMTEPLRSICFEHVTFAYDPAAPVLSDLSFEVKAGEQIGIVGPSGAGKTTLLGLVARFYDPSDGRVLLNGRDLRDYRLADVYAQLGIVTQEPFLFGTTVRGNIRYGRPEATDEEVERAARAAEVHEEILALPDGYDTVVGVGGRSLSGGQIQRVNVARAVLKNAPVLLLDEATSSLDSIAEARVQSAINRLMTGRTTFIVAHRLSTLRHADRILVLDRGRCVGIGTHDALLQTCPLYRKLWRTQELRGAPARAASR